MFKRVEKRIKRREKEDALGITDEANQLMGTPDTDSDESIDSDSESDVLASRKRKRGDEYESSDPYKNEETTEAITIPVRDALMNPVQEMACVLCPGKTIKHSEMERVHLDSAPHKRRMKRFKELVDRLSSQFDDIHSDPAGLVVRLMNEETLAKGLGEVGGERLSNRAKKKHQLKDRRNAMRQWRKASRQSKGPKSQLLVPDSPKRRRKNEKLST